MGPVVDPETGFLYLRARYYDPKTGQFLTPDPMAAITGERYGYAGNDPLNQDDPTGLGGSDPGGYGLPGGHHLPGSDDASDGGRYYRPPKNSHGKPRKYSGPLGQGWIDDSGNVWTWPRPGAYHGGPHWDVEHKGGGHTNVDEDGTVIGNDGFPTDKSLGSSSSGGSGFEFHLTHNEILGCIAVGGGLIIASGGGGILGVFAL